MNPRPLTTLAFLVSFVGSVACTGCSAARYQEPGGRSFTWAQALTDTDVKAKLPDGTEVEFKRTSKGEGVLRKLLGLMGGLF